MNFLLLISIFSRLIVIFLKEIKIPAFIYLIVNIMKDPANHK